MKSRLPFDVEKALAAVKLVLSNTGYVCGFHKLFKILYFAERKHLATYGRLILGDRYIAMQAGPVPSVIYDILKSLRGNSTPFNSKIDFSKFFEVRDKHYVHLIDKQVDIEIFSESELECISDSIEENKFLPFTILKDKSHDYAWHAAEEDDTMSIFDIAKAGGANDELLKYISLNLENNRLEIN